MKLHILMSFVVLPYMSSIMYHAMMVLDKYMHRLF